MNKEQFRGRRILVVGLAKSGEAAAKLLHRLGAEVIVNDRLPYEENEQAKRLEREGIRVVCGGHPLELLDEDFSFIVKNPGIPYTNPLINEAVNRGLSVITEIEISSYISEAPMIAITGSNGKTTTTTLIYEMLNEGELIPLIAGNIGTVSCEVAEKATSDNILIVEVSSFQLVGTETFRPKISVLLNLFDAHLDYHKTKEEYVAAKAKITANQEAGDIFIYNEDDPLVKAVAEKSRATLIPFSKKGKNAAVYTQDGAIYYRGKKIIDIEDIVLPGDHNLENVLAAVGAALEAGAKPERIVHVLKTFSGVEHRLQFVNELKGRRFYNDSKATNLLATEKALQSFTSPIILLAGGLDRGDNFDDLLPFLKNVHTLIAFGETKEKLADSAKKAQVKNIVFADWIEDAVSSAYAHSSEGDVVLLSPACASWDQYKTFEERGDRFIQAIKQLNVAE